MMMVMMLMMMMRRRRRGGGDLGGTAQLQSIHFMVCDQKLGNTVKTLITI